MSLLSRTTADSQHNNAADLKSRQKLMKMLCRVKNQLPPNSISNGLAILCSSMDIVLHRSDSVVNREISARGNFTDTSIIESTLEQKQSFYFNESPEKVLIYNAARLGYSTQDCIMYTSKLPNIDTIHALIMAGIAELHYYTEDIQSDETAEMLQHIENQGRISIRSYTANDLNIK